MQQTQADPLVDVLVNDFGGNYTFALEQLDQYRRDRQSVDASWRQYFDRLMGVPQQQESPGWTSGAQASAPAQAGSPAKGGGLVRQEQATALVRDKGKALMVPAILPGDIAQPIRGGALRVVENMEASLQVPTATSMRSVPVRTLEENRRILNKHRDATAASKISFTHLVAWAIVRALDTFPRLNDAYAELEGQPHRIQRDEIRLGIAVDVQKKDGTRTLFVPNIKGANRMDFAQFVKAFDDLVGRARKGTISPDDFMGTTASL